MAPVNGRPFIEWVVRWLKKGGIEHVVISTGYRSEALEQHFLNQPVSGVNVSCVREPEPLGTGGAIRYAVEKSKLTPNRWLVMNGDSLIFADIHSVFGDRRSIDGIIVTREVPDASRYGSVLVGSDGIIRSFSEKKGGGGMINGGIYLLPHKLIEWFPPLTPLSLEKEVIPNVIARGGRLLAYKTDAAFLDIGTPESLLHAERFVCNNMDQFDHA